MRHLNNILDRAVPIAIGRSLKVGDIVEYIGDKLPYTKSGIEFIKIHSQLKSAKLQILEDCGLMKKVIYNGSNTCWIWADYLRKI